MIYRWLLALMCIAAVTVAGAQPPAQEALRVPVEYYKLENGLKVVLSPDTSAPVAITAVYYNIGFRIEPKNRTGFAHLFEHMMFQGSQNLGKMEFIRLMQRNGGVLNGSTRFDFTNYFEILPSNKLETMLWAEADRMHGLTVTQQNLDNQRAVVENEVKVNVLNQPYGGFPWLDVPQYANTNWYNAHNFYGDLKDLDSANLADVQSFFHTYYAPNNASLAVVGDFDPAEAKQLIRKYFGDIPAVPQPPKPDLTEPPQTAPRQVTKTDSLANRPAIAMAWHMPPRNTPEFYAMGLIDQILLQGEDKIGRAHV
jgi:zinc protease